MSKIVFHKNVEFAGFNLGKEGIAYPSGNNPNENDVDESIVCSFVNRSMYDGVHVQARYQSQALARDKFILYRQDESNKNKTYLATIDGVTNGFSDYNVNSNGKYKYTVETSPNDKDDDNTSSSISLETPYFVSPSWQYWSICDIERHDASSEQSMMDVYIPSDTVFIIKNNVNVGTINDNLNVIKYNTLGQYGKVVQNKQKYDSGNISCLIGDFAVTHDRLQNKKIIIKEDISTVEQIDDWFINLPSNDEYKHQDYYQYAFYFPNAQYKYYVYSGTVGKEIYRVLQAEPDNWSELFENYYEQCTYGFNISGYKKLDCVYKHIDAKPDNWETNYYHYFIQVGGIYKYNTNEQWDSSVTYYEFTNPEYEDNKFYQLLVHGWLPVDSRYRLLNTFETLSEWRNCISNGKKKLLKAPNGSSWVVSVSDQTSLDIDWKSSDYPATISFNWQEVLDKNKISIIKW